MAMTGAVAALDASASPRRARIKRNWLRSFSTWLLPRNDATLPTMPEEMWMKEMHPGVFAGDKTMPIDSVACYVPRGKGSFPSVLMMTAIPAVVAGVPNAIVVAPPRDILISGLIKIKSQMPPAANSPRHCRERV